MSRRIIKTLRLTGVIFYRGVSDSRFSVIQPEDYQEDERGLFLFEKDSDVWIPWTSVLAITYSKPLVDQVKAALPPTLDTFLAEPPAKPQPTKKKGGKNG